MASESATRVRVEGARFLSPATLDAVFAVLSLLMVTGIALDARAHAQGISFAEEGFLTPEHAFFYSMFLVIAVLLAGVTFSNRREGKSFVEAVPTGYGVGVIGVLIFGFGGVGDFFWHSTFGFEQGVEALTSPSHISIATGGVLFLSSPLRAAWKRSGTPSSLSMGAALLSGLLAFALVGLFAGLINPIMRVAVFVEYPAAVQLGVAGFMTFPMLLVGVGLAMARRFELPFGSLTVVFLGPGLIGLAVNPEYAPLLLAFVAAGVVADALVHFAPPTPGRGLSLRLFGAAVPLAFAGTYFAVAAGVIPEPVVWSVHVWTGAVTLAALGGVIVTYIAVPDATTER